MTQIWWLGLVLAILSLAAVAQPFALPILAARRGSPRFIWWYIAGVTPVLAGCMVVGAGLQFGFDTVLHPSTAVDATCPDYDLVRGLALLGIVALVLILSPSFVFAWCAAHRPPPSKGAPRLSTMRAWSTPRANGARSLVRKIGAPS